MEKDKKTKKALCSKIFAGAVILCIIIATDIGVWMLDALVIQKLWNWFIYPITNFHFTYWNMFGALLIPTVLITATTFQTQKNEDKEGLDIAAEHEAILIVHAISTLIVWGLGAIIA